MTADAETEQVTRFYVTLLAEREALDERIEATKTVLLSSLMKGENPLMPGEERTYQRGPFRCRVHQGLRRKVDEEALNAIMHAKAAPQLFDAGAIAHGKPHINWAKVKGLPGPMRDALEAISDVSMGPLTLKITQAKE